MEYQQIGAWRHGPVVSTETVSSLWRAVVLESVLVRCWWVVFGTLLGPEATGPWFMAVPRFVRGVVVGCGVCLFLVSWLHRSCTVASCGVVCGVCGLGLLFENYIVDASIFYKKQFPRI